MRLLQAHIRGFGRLVEREFEFSPEVQIVVGANEAGKSTLQQFLLAMLFGMKREDRKRRDYLPQYELYRPWNSEHYEGRLVYKLSDGDRFEVQRVFDREREVVKILDAVTGRDLSEEFPMDSRKERLLMQSQLELSRKLFEATTSLGQLSGRPASEGVGALRERIQGLLDSGDEEVSASYALASLNRLRENLGSVRTPTRGIGLLMNERQLRLSELEAARVRHSEILELHERRAEAIQAHLRAEHAWRGQRALERARERDELDRRMQAAESLEQRLEVARQGVEAYADVADLEVASYAPARERAAAIAALEREVREQAARIDVLQGRAVELAEFGARLEELLGGMDRDLSLRLQSESSRLQEEIGRVREARRRHAQEQLQNRAVVESLRGHHGRDWTREDFMARLARHRAAEEMEVEPVQRRLEEQEHLYRRQRLRFALAVSLGILAVSGLAFVGWLYAGAVPLLVRIGTPLAAMLLGLAMLPSGLRRLMAQRDQSRALVAQATRILAHRKEAREWLHEVLLRNDIENLEELDALRREYESLRAQAERSAAESHSGELLEHQNKLRRLAAELHAQVGRCDLGALRTLIGEPGRAVLELLPYAEETHVAPAHEDDPAELRHLLEDLAVLPELRRYFQWLERLREERHKLQEAIETLRRQHEPRIAELEGAQEALRIILQRNGAQTLEEFAERVERFQERQRAIAEYVPLQREQAGVLGGETLAALRARQAVLHAEVEKRQDLRAAASTQVALELGAAVEAGSSAFAATEGTLEDLRQEVERLAAVRAQLEERLVAREREGRMPAEIELQIQEFDARLAEAQERDEALALAARTLESVAAARHREVAPHMNTRVGEIFAQLSRGAHSEVQLDEDLTPRVRMDGGHVYGAESLSGGAADQLYFAMRVTAGEQLARSGERLPLLLDDPFVQYDPERLHSALDLVTELARQHQVLFFTCEEEQGAALAERVGRVGIDSNLVHL